MQSDGDMCVERLKRGRESFCLMLVSIHLKYLCDQDTPLEASCFTKGFEGVLDAAMISQMLESKSSLFKA